MHRSILHKKLEGDRLICEACKLKCVIKKGQAGICGIRQNIDGDLFLLVYGKASAVNIDPIEKKPLYHFLPTSNIFSLGTIGCNFGCTFCQNWNLSQVGRGLRMKLKREQRLSALDLEVSTYGYELAPEKIVEICIEKNIPSIAYTYNEPVIFFEYLYDTARIASAEGIRTVFVSNGYESRASMDLIHPYLDAMNIDLKSFSNTFYTRYCKAKLSPVLDTIREAYAMGIWLEITTLLIPGENDSDQEIEQIAEFIVSIDESIPWHLSAFHPDYKMKYLGATPL